ncbi:MAG: nucleotidyl transferase AbiEii/AbiGii toxin family protein [Parcubacteria group bacterium]|nr:nucleotidyl transferase AbiEii/AbiGii toxin family protein [Parcubacteria group bacterium]
MEQIDPRHLLVKIAQILEGLEIPYFITGGMAVLVWGRPRFTADIDILIEFKVADVDKLEAALNALGETGYVDKDAMREALLREGEFNFIDGNTGVKVDFWILKKNSFDVFRMKRRVARDILNQRVYFISPEDLVLNKLLWYQESQSSRHLEDAESVFKISGENLDKDYLNKWAEKLNVSELLRRFISD